MKLSSKIWMVWIVYIWNTVEKMETENIKIHCCQHCWTWFWNIPYKSCIFLSVQPQVYITTAVIYIFCWNIEAILIVIMISQVVLSHISMSSLCIWRLFPIGALLMDCRALGTEGPHKFCFLTEYRHFSFWLHKERSLWTLASFSFFSFHLLLCVYKNYSKQTLWKNDVYKSHNISVQKISFKKITILQ